MIIRASGFFLAGEDDFGIESVQGVSRRLMIVRIQLDLFQVSELPGA
ncbi:hypothetical protein HMPREF1861_00265 [Corynebacterium kroppenstedtii]|nr:hypothetical protein HMPREF1861_00265 [Corynebacterium kroppenstedtii]